jgi:hypothetical protein
VSVLGDASSTGTVTDTPVLTGTDPTTDGTGSTAGGTQIVTPILIPVGVEGVSISVGGDATTEGGTTGTESVPPGDGTGTGDGSGDGGTPGDGGVGSGSGTSGVGDVSITAAATSAQQLAVTGVNPTVPLLGGIVLVLLGTLLIVFRARSRRAPRRA